MMPRTKKNWQTSVETKLSMTCTLDLLFLLFLFVCWLVCSLDCLFFVHFFVHSIVHFDLLTYLRMYLCSLLTWLILSPLSVCIESSFMWYGVMLTLHHSQSILTTNVLLLWFIYLFFCWDCDLICHSMCTHSTLSVLGR